MMNRYSVKTRQLISQWLEFGEGGEYRQVRLTRILADSTALILILRAILLVLGNAQVVTPIATLFPIVLLLGASVISRTKHYPVATVLTVVAVFLLPYLIAYNQSESISNGALFLTFANASIILAFLFFDTRVIALVIVAHLIAVLVAGRHVLDLTTAEIGLVLGSNAVMALLVFISSILRQRDQVMIEAQTRASKESQARYQTLFGATFESLIIHDYGRIIDINPSAEKLFGYHADEIKGKYLADVLMDTLAMRHVEAWSEDELIPYESTGLKRDGEVVPVEVLTKAFTYGGAEVRVSAVRDITYRKQFEKQLRRQVAMEQLISRTSRQFTNVSSDLSDRGHLEHKITEALQEISEYVYADRGFLLLAFDDHSAPSQPVYEWSRAGQDLPIDIGGVLPTTMWSWWQDKLQNGEHLEILDVNALPVEAHKEQNTLQLYGIQSVLLLPLLYGDELNGFIGVASTQRTSHWTEADIRLLNIMSEIFVNAVSRSHAEIARLRSDRQFSKIFRNSPLPIGIARFPQSEFVDVNESFINLVGYTRDEIIGKTTLDLNLWENLDRNPWTTDKIRTVGGFINLETKLRTKLGDSRDVLLALESIDLNGEESMIVIISDITDHKQSEARERAFALEREQVEILHKFISEVSHDFKTPLSTMRTSTYLIEKKLELNRPVNEYLKTIDIQIDQMQRLLEGLLTMSRLDKIDTSEFEFQHYDLNALVKEVVLYNQMRYKDKQHTVVYELDDSLPRLPLDDNAIRQALGNVLENAYIYSEDKGTITIRTHRDATNANFAMIEIEDTGDGISKADLPYIFNRFYKANKARTSGVSGTGLGLPIARRIVEAHHGRISAESVEEQGSVFRICLPLNHEIARLEMNPFSASALENA